MTDCALRQAIEYFLTTRSRLSVEAAFRRRGRRYGKLIEMQRCKFCGGLIGSASHVSETVPRSDRKFYRIIQARIIEGPFAVHLQVGHKGIPMCHRPPAGPRVEVDACETESGRNQCRGGLSIRPESFAVEEKLGVEFPRPPTGERRPDGRYIDPQEISHRLEIGGERHDRSDIEVTVGPAVQPAADARR